MQLVYELKVAIVHAKLHRKTSYKEAKHEEENDASFSHVSCERPEETPRMMWGRVKMALYRPQQLGMQKLLNTTIQIFTES